MTDAFLTAEKLLQSGALKLRPEEPFTWASGWKSPIYCDNRRILSQPHFRDYIKSELCNLVFDKFPNAEAIAGVATAGIAWGALVADQLKLPFLYVRPKPKEHGLGNQIEGELKEGSSVVVLEDLISTGKSSLQVVEVLRNKGARVEGMAAIFSYGFPNADQAFQDAGVELHCLTNYGTLLELGQQKDRISADTAEILLKWRTDPASWTGVH